jgi:hypothetical protein
MAAGGAAYVMRNTGGAGANTYIIVNLEDRAATSIRGKLALDRARVIAFDA